MANEQKNQEAVSCDYLLNKNATTHVLTILRESSSTSPFFHYTSADSATKILGGHNNEHYFFLNPLCRMNDIGEALLHKEDQDTTYVLSFCDTKLDSIPMWYLYAGVTGEGVKIGFTAKKLSDLIDNIKIIYAVNGNKIEYNNAYILNEDFSLDCGWVFYHRNFSLIRYRRVNYKLHDSPDIFRKENFFIKDYPWNYENEFRIVIRIHSTKQLPEKIAIPFNKDKLKTGISVYLGPEAHYNPNKTPYTLSSYAEKFEIDENKVHLSTLGIKMDLLGRNRDSILEHFDLIIAGLPINRAQTAICEHMEMNDLCHMPELRNVAASVQRGVAQDV